MVLTDRYIYSLIARAIVRGADPTGSTVLRVRAQARRRLLSARDRGELVPRVLQTAGFDYWESGMDLPMGEDLYDRFIAYQSRLLAEFDRMAGEYGFQVVDTSVSILTVSEQIRAFSRRCWRLYQRQPSQASTGSR